MIEMLIAAALIAAVILADAAYPPFVRYKGSGPARRWINLYPRPFRAAWGFWSFSLGERAYELTNGHWAYGPSVLCISKYEHLHISFGRFGYRDDLRREFKKAVWLQII